MATDKKHIAVYLDPAVEQALIAFCESKGLISKKGTMFSAGVNAALAQFFGIADTDTDVTVTEKGNTPATTGNILLNLVTYQASYLVTYFVLATHRVTYHLKPLR